MAEGLDYGTEGEGVKAPFDLDGKVLSDMDGNAGWTSHRSAGDHFQKAMRGCWVFTESATPEIKPAWGNMGLPAIAKGALAAFRLLLYDAPPMGAPFRRRHTLPPDYQNLPSAEGLHHRLDQVKMSTSDAYMPNTTKSATTNSPVTTAPYPSSITMSVQKTSPQKPSKKEAMIKRGGLMLLVGFSAIPMASIIHPKELPSPVGDDA